MLPYEWSNTYWDDPLATIPQLVNSLWVEVVKVADRSGDFGTRGKPLTCAIREPDPHDEAHQDGMGVGVTVLAQRGMVKFGVREQGR